MVFADATSVRAACRGPPNLKTPSRAPQYGPKGRCRRLSRTVKTALCDDDTEDMRPGIERGTWWTRVTVTALFAVLLAVVATLTGVGTSPALAASSGRVVTIDPQSDFTAVVATLRAGDTLSLLPGTYNVGLARFYAGPFPYPRHGNLNSGTPTARITIRAADPTSRPLLQGLLSFQGADYLTLDGLRVQATLAGQPALRMTDGTGWVVQNSEFFGARQTYALANVEIGGGLNPDRRGQPAKFAFIRNAVHDASNAPRALYPDRAVNHTEHNLYLYFAGSGGSGGTVSRNLIWGHPNGEGIKIGSGGAYGARGPWSVTVSYNTIADGGRQILLHGDVRYNVIKGNLLWRATQHFNTDPRTTQIYVHDVTGKGNVITHNYAYGSSMFMFDPSCPFAPQRSIVASSANILSAAKSADPGLLSRNTVGGWHTTNAAASAYGRWGTGTW